MFLKIKGIRKSYGTEENRIPMSDALKNVE